MSDMIRPSEVYEWCMMNLNRSEFEVYKSDLYVKVTDKSKEMASKMLYKSLLTTFVSSDGTLWYDVPFGALGAHIADCERERIKEKIIMLDMRLQELGAYLTRFLDAGFDPDAYYTPVERSLAKLCDEVGMDYHDVNEKAYNRLVALKGPIRQKPSI